MYATALQPQPTYINTLVIAGASNAPIANVICKRLSATGLPSELSLIIALLIMLIEPRPIPISTNAAYMITTDGIIAINIHDNGIRNDIATIDALRPILAARSGNIKLASRLPIANADKSPPATL